MKDLTRDYDYQRLLEEEKECYSRIEVTEDLKEGGLAASSAWRYYWQKVGQVINQSEFADIPSYLSRTLAHLQRPIEVLSLGSGYCGHELEIARGMRHPYRIRCTDINEKLFDRARKVALNEGLSLEFEQADLNFITIEPNRYDLVYTHAAIHHVVNLEQLFHRIARGLTENGIFHIVEVVGKDRSLIWDENLRLLNALLDAVPDSVTDGLRVQLHEKPSLLGVAKEWAKRLLGRRKAGFGMEGIRQSEIMPLLRQFFTSLYEHQHGAFIRFVCTYHALSPRFNPQNAEARRYLDFLIEVDNAAVRNGVLRPLEIWGVYKPRTGVEVS
jgi:ubiquinone/menaquinone biosynthesis C-methylase UbiE